MKRIAIPRRLALDTVGYCTPYIDAIKRVGVSTVFRYLRRDFRVRDTPDTSGDWLVSLSVQELRELTAADLCVGLVQVGSRSVPATAANGERVGDAAGKNAKALAVPEGVTLWCDCEWSSPPQAWQSVEYIEAWAQAVRAHGYRAGLYVSQDLNGIGREGLYRLAGITGYWYSASAIHGVAVRGPQLVQSLEYVLTDTGLGPWVSGAKGLRCDLDLARIDCRGNRCQVIAA